MNDSNLNAIYKEIILDHYSNPRGCRELDKVTDSEHGHNVSCGDKVDVKFSLKDNTITDMSVCTKGCAICVSSGSIMYKILKGMGTQKALQTIEVIKHFFRGEGDLPETLSENTELRSLEGIKKYPARIKCVILPWLTSEKILNKH